MGQMATDTRYCILQALANECELSKPRPGGLLLLLLRVGQTTALLPFTTTAAGKQYVSLSRLCQQKSLDNHLTPQCLPGFISSFPCKPKK